MNKKVRETIERTLFVAVEGGDLTSVRNLCAEHPWMIKDHLWTREDTWLGHAVRIENIEMVTLLLELGFNVDSMDSGIGGTTALDKAIHNDQDAIVELLLARGANPNLSRPVISTLNRQDHQRKMKYLRLLVEAGVNLNNRFSLGGDEDFLFTALDGCEDDGETTAEEQEVIDFLRQHGAMTSKELNTSPNL